MYDIPYSSLDRHKKNHLAKSMVKAKQAADVAEATGLLARVERITGQVEMVFNQAVAQRSAPGTIAAARELRGCLELLGKLSGELQGSSGGNSGPLEERFSAIIDEIGQQDRETVRRIYSRLTREQVRILPTLHGTTEDEDEEFNKLQTHFFKRHGLMVKSIDRWRTIAVILSEASGIPEEQLSEESRKPQPKPRTPLEATERNWDTPEKAKAYKYVDKERLLREAAEMDAGTRYCWCASFPHGGVMRDKPELIPPSAL
jgi:hypothetical protein